MISENMFETLEEAYEFAVESWKDMAPKFVRLKKLKAELEEERVQLMQQVDMEKSRNAELFEKWNELKKIVDDFDTTTVQKLNSEINDANDVIVCLEAEKTKLAKDLLVAT